MTLKKTIAFFAVIVSFLACVDPYAVQILSSKSYLFVEGSITNSAKQNPIQIVRTDASAVFESLEFSRTIVGDIRNENIPLTSAKVYVVEDENNRINLSEKEPGIYILPKGFAGKVGRNYQLVIETSEGATYQSNPEIMQPVPEIKNIYDVYNKEGIKRNNFYGERISTNDVFVDFDDPAEQKNYYTWQWTQYEQQVYCATCKQGRYFQSETPNGVVGNCVTESRLNFNNFFDYFCDSSCWDIFYSSDINILSDIYTNGREQIGKLVAQVPVYQRNPALVAIEQRSLTANAFRYLKLIQDQSVNTGTLVDTPPAPIKSNVTNINDSGELVLGFFTASAVSEKRYMLQRTGITNVLPNNLFIFQNAREPGAEPVNDIRPSIPPAFCIDGASRTPFTPEGWLLRN
jgi:hypothetical protein